MTDFHLPSDEVADRAIDRAVREIMSAEPGPGFRYRVMRRLSGPEPVRWSWTRRGMAAAAVALLLAVAVWIRPVSDSEPASVASVSERPALVTPPTPREAPPARPLRAAPPTTTGVESPRLAQTVVAPGDAIVRAASLATDEGGDAMAGGEVPDSPDRLVVPAIPQAASSVAPIAIDAIVIKDITVAPIAAVRR